MSTLDDEGLVKPFATTLQEVAGGKAATRASELLHQCTTAVMATGKKAVLTVTVTVEPYKKGNTATLDVTVKSVAKLPEGDEATASAVFFPTKGGNLSREDPTQMRLPLRLADEKGKNTA